MNSALAKNFKLSPVNVEARQKLEFRAGDTVRVWVKVLEDAAKQKYRLQAFEGLVLARKHGNETGATFTVRKVASGVGVERVFPLYSPSIDKIEIVKRSRVRRSKLYYVREKAIRDVRRKMKQTVLGGGSTKDFEAAPEAPVAEAKAAE
jgi:large subunit ribosomal protein L19